MTHECPVCNRPATEFLNRPSVPVHQNLIFPTATAARGIRRGQLSLCVCSACEFVFNSAFDPSLLSYGQEYDNSQTFSPAFAAHVDGLVAELIDSYQVRNSRVVEVGCGKGDFLRRLVGAAAAGNTGFGFDPSYAGPDTDLDGRLRFVRTMYDERAAELAADVVVCRHVIEHVPAPLELLRSVRRAVTRPTARLFFETPCVEWILRNQVVWDFFYEHCSLFTAGSLAFAFRSSGFAVKSVRHLFGGQYLWLVAEPARSGPVAPPEKRAIESLAHDYARVERARVANWQNEIARIGRTGRLAVWGAGAKGVTFCNLVDPEGNRLACTIDVNPAKQGCYIAGTGHAIVSPDELSERGITDVLVLNPNYTDEIRRDVAKRSTSIAVHDLMSRN